MGQMPVGAYQCFEEAFPPDKKEGMNFAADNDHGLFGAQLKAAQKWKPEEPALAARWN